MIGSDFNYYTAPSDEIFNEIKDKAILLWKTYDNTYGYVDEKVDRIKTIKNFQDNAWYIVSMFDIDNQRKLLNLLETPAKIAVMTMLQWSYEQG